jgi:hypothetical protein
MIALALRVSLVVVGSWGSPPTRSKLSPLTERSRTSPLSSGIRFPSWLVSLSSIFPFLQSPENPTKIYFQVSRAHSFNKYLCWICVLTRSIIVGYLCFLPFVPSFLVTLVSSPLLIHTPPRAHIHHAAASRSPIPVLWCDRSKKE